MEIKDMKTKVKIVFPEESEIFMAEEFLEELHKVSLTEKPVEIDLSGVQSIDTVFMQLAISMIKTINNNKNKLTLRLSEAVEEKQVLYGLDLSSMVGGI